MTEKTLKEINEEIEMLKKKEKELADEQKKAKITEGFAFNCGECGKYVENPSSKSQVKIGICPNCQDKKNKEKRKQQVKSLVGAVIVKVEPSSWGGSIESMIIVKDGFGFELKGDPDDDVSQIEISEEGRMQIPLELHEHLKPGNKTRPKNEQKITHFM
jgi:hypothetical protein